MRIIMIYIVKDNVIEDASTPYSLISINVSDKNNLRPLNEVKMSTASNAKFKKLALSKEEKSEFRQAYQLMLKELITKLQDRSPLKYPLRCTQSC